MHKFKKTNFMQSDWNLFSKLSFYFILFESTNFYGFSTFSSKIGKKLSPIKSANVIMLICFVKIINNEKKVMIFENSSNIHEFMCSKNQMLKKNKLYRISVEDFELIFGSIS